jgi:hypothetical protein
LTDILVVLLILGISGFFSVSVAAFAVYAGKKN